MIRSGGRLFCCNTACFRKHLIKSNVFELHKHRSTVAVADYPEIKPKYPPGRWSNDMTQDVCWDIFEQGKSIKQLASLKERLESFAGTEAKWMVDLSSFDLTPEILDYKQYLTKTHVITSLPPQYESIIIDAVYELVKPQIESAITQAFHFYEDHKPQNDDLLDSEVKRKYSAINKCMGNIVSLLVSQLSQQSSGLRRSQLDENVRVESWFKRYGFAGDEKPVKDKWNGIATVQFKTIANFQIRTELPISEFVPLDNKLCTEAAYPQIDYAPMAIGQSESQGRPITVSGHWVDDPCEFTPLSVHIMPPRVTSSLSELGSQYLEEATLVAGLTSSFGSCLAQAHNQGFNWIFDLTYPITTQTVVVRDNMFRLCCYQLNTTHLWKDDAANPLRNIMWASSEQRLFDSISPDGKVIGFNDELCKMLIKFFLMPTSNRGGINLRPYLPDEQAPRLTNVFINHKGTDPLPRAKTGRWQYPKSAVYF